MTKANVKPNRGSSATLWSGQTKYDPTEAVENALILDPESPSDRIAELLVTEADPEYIVAVARDHFAKLIKIQRRKMMAAKHEQPRLPGFEHLPLRILIAPDRRQKLMNATYRGTREYYKHLSAAYDQRKDGDAKLKEAKALMELMREKSQTDRGITVGRALGLK